MKAKDNETIWNIVDMPKARPSLIIRQKDAASKARSSKFDFDVLINP
jgi:hypothetical protein